MHSLKTQIEVKYTPILNFREVYKGILAPYAKLARFSINNADSIQEFIVLNIPEANALIDVRWDRMIYTCDGKPANLFASNGALFNFLTIFRRLQESASFGELLGIGLWEWYLLPVNKSEQEIISLFKDKYLNNELPYLTGFKQQNLEIQADFQDHESSVRLQFRPYDATDGSALQLTPIGSAAVTSLLTQKGILSQVVAFDKSKQLDLELLTRLDQKVLNLVDQIKI